MPTTPGGLRYPDSTDFLTNAATAMQLLAEDVEADLDGVRQDLADLDARELASTSTLTEAVHRRLVCGQVTVATPQPGSPTNETVNLPAWVTQTPTITLTTHGGDQDDNGRPFIATFTSATSSSFNVRVFALNATAVGVGVRVNWVATWNGAH